MKFLNLIEAVTFLNQYQRPRKLTPEGLEYIESTLEDYRIAYTIAKDVIGDSQAELMKPERDFFEKLKDLARERRKSFTARHAREYTGTPSHAARRLLNTLVEMEYLLVLDGSKGRKYEYTIHPDFALGEEVISGLTTPEELARELETNGLILSLVKPC